MSRGAPTSYETVDDFTPSRLSLARRRRGVTKKDLAEAADVSTRSLSDYESGNQAPTHRTLERLSAALEFPSGFFRGDDIDELPLDAASFRALSRLTARQRDQAIGSGTLALDLMRWIDERFELPDVDVPDLRGVDSETAAEGVRTEWGLGQRPIANVVHLLEAHGVRVFSLVQDAAEVDAYSAWTNSGPMVFLNTQKSAERSRMDAAHELGHLVLHRGHGAPRGRDEEHQADLFASAFLMPRSSVLASAPRTTSLALLIHSKKIWGVSVAALVFRMHQIGLLTEWQYRTTFRELASRGYRKQEPDERPRETSQMLKKVFESLAREGVSKSQVAKQLRIPTSELNRMVFGLVPTVLEGEGQGAESHEGPNLRVV